MRRFALFCVLILLACKAASPSGLAPEPATETISPSEPSVIPSDPRDSTAEPASTTPFSPSGFSVRFHPDGELYVGDQISFEVTVAEPVGINDRQIQVIVPTQAGLETVEAHFAQHGLGGRTEAIFVWSWNTGGLPPGEHTLQFSLLPNGPSWTESVRLLPTERLPALEAGANWETVKTGCCELNYVAGTKAERDLVELMAEVDQQLEQAAERIGIGLGGEPLVITFLPRVLGHGGFAGKEISLSYLDRDYMGGEKARVLHHEIIHILDGRLGGDLRPLILVEGLAVYLSDGHFKAEPLLPRAAALLPPDPGCASPPPGRPAAATPEACGLNRYIPLKTLIDSFYTQQHEIEYLQAGALVQYMVDRWGWQAYSDFYRDIHPPDRSAAGDRTTQDQQSRALELGLRKHFDLGLDELEADFIEALRQQQVTAEIVEDLALTVQFYDAARSYQLRFDPSAHFLTAWLPDGEEMRKRGIVADILRRPSRPENLVFETMLAEANARLAVGDYAAARLLVEAVETALAAYPDRGLAAFEAHPTAADYMAVVQAALEAGYEPQRITIKNGTARMLVNASGPGITELVLLRGINGWVLTTASSLNPVTAGLASLIGGYGQLHNIPLSALKGAWQYRFR